MTTAAMHSSGFYWLGWTANGTGFSYTVTTNTFELRLAVMLTHWDTCEPGKKLETRQKPVSPLKTTARTSMQSSLKNKANQVCRKLLFPDLSRNLFLCFGGFHQRARWGGVHASECSSGEEEAAGLAGGGNPRFYRNVVCVMCTWLRAAKARFTSTSGSSVGEKHPPETMLAPDSSTDRAGNNKELSMRRRPQPT